MAAVVLDNSAVARFLKRVQAVSQARSKEIRLSVEEATELAANIGELVSHLAAMQSHVLSVSTKPGGGMDGGTL